MNVLMDLEGQKVRKEMRAQWDRKEIRDVREKRAHQVPRVKGDFLDVLEILDKLVWMVLMVFQEPQVSRETKVHLDPKETWAKWDLRVKQDTMDQRES